ncbi:MAG TPA: hypothetical protein VKE69_05255 [Planctomycetota bacterium]|nr:hypothetical protein [Planctomycetota bacterium]
MDDSHAPGDGRGGDVGERPPVGGSWGVLYAAVLIAFVCEAIALAALSRAFG